MAERGYKTSLYLSSPILIEMVSPTEPLKLYDEKTQTNASNQTLLNQHKISRKTNFPLSNRGGGVLTYELRGRVRGVSQTKYSHAPHNDISVNDGPHIRRWSHNIIILTIVLQLPTIFSTVTCCTGL
jgi:hypothetical protein